MIWRIFHFSQGFIDNRWCRISSINSSTWKWMVGILISFWGGLFAGAILVLGSVVTLLILQKFCIDPVSSSCVAFRKNRNPPNDPEDFYFIVFSCEDGGTKPDNFLRSFLFSSLLSNKDTQNLGSKNRRRFQDLKCEWNCCEVFWEAKGGLGFPVPREHHSNRESITLLSTNIAMENAPF